MQEAEGKHGGDRQSIWSIPKSEQATYFSLFSIFLFLGLVFLAYHETLDLGCHFRRGSYTPTVSKKRWNAVLMSFSDAPFFWRSRTRLKASRSCSWVIVISSDPACRLEIGFTRIVAWRGVDGQQLPRRFISFGFVSCKAASVIAVSTVWLPASGFCHAAILVP